MSSDTFSDRPRRGPSILFYFFKLVICIRRFDGAYRIGRNEGAVVLLFIDVLQRSAVLVLIERSTISRKAGTAAIVGWRDHKRLQPRSVVMSFFDPESYREDVIQPPAGR